MDKETQEVYTQQKTLESLVGHDGWPIARQMFVDKILSLQNAFEIKADDAQKMFIDLEARKLATTTLVSFLQELEGSASQAKETKRIVQKHIIREE